MPNTAIATQVHEPLDIHRNLASQIAFDRVLGNFTSKLLQLFFAELADLASRRNACFGTDLMGTIAPDAVDVG